MSKNDNKVAETMLNAIMANNADKASECLEKLMSEKTKKRLKTVLTSNDDGKR